MELTTNISLSRLRLSKTNPRRAVEPAALEGLANSIRKHGVVQAIVVRKVGKTYEIVTGSRRFLASKAAKRKTIPAVVCILNDQEASEIQLIENLQREDVHPLDEAQGFERLLSSKKHTVAMLAAQIGKPIAYVEQRRKLLDLIPAARKAFILGGIQLGHAIVLARLQKQDQQRALAFALRTWQEYDGDYVQAEDNPREYESREANGAVMPAQTVCSLADLQKFIAEHIHLDLRAAAFDKKDPKLVKAAGSCLSCPKRSGFSKELFNDITRKDICTDPGCFATKQAAHIAALKTTLRKGKKKYVEVTKDYRKPQGHPSARTMRSVKEVTPGSCKYARVGILVDGARKGKTTTVCLEKTCKRHWNDYTAPTRTAEPPAKKDTPKQAAQRIVKEREARITHYIKESLTDRIIQEITERPPKNFKLEHLRALATYLDQSYESSRSMARKVLKLPKGVQDFKEEQLVPFIHIALMGLYAQDMYEEFPTLMAQCYGVNIDELAETLKGIATKNEREGKTDY